VQTWKLIDTKSMRESVACRQPEKQEYSLNIPVLPETLLSFELMICEPVVDLAGISRIVTSDLGATIQVMRLAGGEFASSAEQKRIEDCISGLGLRRCVDAMSGRTAEWSERRAVIRGAWIHAREIAELCAALSEQMPDRNPQEAYLVGLFHELGNLPDVLDWERGGHRKVDEDTIGLSLAKSWALPSCVQQYFINRNKLDESCTWAQLVGVAHQLSSHPQASYPYKGPRSVEIIRSKSAQGFMSA
jgi:hypothetical protein